MTKPYRLTGYTRPKIRKVPRMLEKDGLTQKYFQGPNYWQNCIVVRQRNGICETLGRHNPTYSMRRQLYRIRPRTIFL